MQIDYIRLSRAFLRIVAHVRFCAYTARIRALEDKCYSWDARHERF
jgi:hypothetical protein